MTHISASILSADFSCLGHEIQMMEQAGAHMFHMDVMDGHFVPNLTFGAQTIKHLRHLSKLPFETHLMLTDPLNYIKSFADAGSDLIFVHIESHNNVYACLERIKLLGKRAGIAINPETSPDALKPFWELIDALLIMTVHPGFGGQKFLDSQWLKIEQILFKRPNHVTVQVDGGVNKTNAPKLARMGVDALVAGSALFNALPKTVENYKRNLQCLTQQQ